MFPSIPCTLLFILLGVIYPLIYILRAASFRANHHQNGRKLPPGPRSLPILGNLLMLGTLPHHTLRHLAQKYGDVMSIRLGQVHAVVVSSPEAAELFLKTHDNVFASRPIVQASVYMSYGTKGLAFTPYGAYWRHVRKLCTLQLLCGSRIESFEPLRRAEVDFVLGSLRKAAAARGVVDLTTVVGDLIQNITCKMLFGKTCRDGGADLKRLIKESLFLAGSFNVGDYVPFLGPLDIQGLKKRMKAFAKTMDEVLQKIIDEHEQEQSPQTHQKDFIDALLSLMNQPTNTSDDEPSYKFDRTNIKAIIIDMIVAAFDTSAVTIDWIFSELMRHPRVMKCLQEELRDVVGMDRKVEETHLTKLPYLDMVIKETFRLHPIAPLLVPHESMEDITINGYHIPKKSRIIVNVYAIGRDSKIWSDNVEEFIPERFEDTNIDLRGRDFQLIPFGAGRRGCPGLQLGLTTVRLVVAQLAHCFNWELPSRVLPDDLDMSEEFGLAVSRAAHLLVMPTYRLGS